MNSHILIGHNLVETQYTHGCFGQGPNQPYPMESPHTRPDAGKIYLASQVQIYTQDKIPCHYILLELVNTVSIVQQLEHWSKFANPCPRHSHLK